MLPIFSLSWDQEAEEDSDSVLLKSDSSETVSNEDEVSDELCSSLTFSMSVAARSNELRLNFMNAGKLRLDYLIVIGELVSK